MIACINKSNQDCFRPSSDCQTAQVVKNHVKYTALMLCILKVIELQSGFYKTLCNHSVLLLLESSVLLTLATLLYPKTSLTTLEITSAYLIFFCHPHFVCLVFFITVVSISFRRALRKKFYMH